MDQDERNLLAGSFCLPDHSPADSHLAVHPNDCRLGNGLASETKSRVVRPALCADTQRLLILKFSQLYGWESQLLEMGFLAMFLSPVLSYSQFPRHTPTSWTNVWGNRWMIFGIMIGAVRFDKDERRYLLEGLDFMLVTLKSSIRDCYINVTVTGPIYSSPCTPYTPNC
uniref:Lipase maturation factor n=2 Tax=Amphimedon queenslandica TaxID=400682 RepID=A0A1X7SRR1_AMPQE